MGVTVRQKVKGRGKPWTVFICHQGKRKSIQVGDKVTADRVARSAREKLAAGQINLEKRKVPPTFEEYSQLWLDGYIKTMRRGSTYESYAQKLKGHVLPVLGSKRLDQISRGDVRDLLISKFQDGFSKSTVGLIRDVISGIFNYAVDEEIVSVNPASGITKRLNLRREKKEAVDPFNAEELSLFLQACLESEPEYYPFFLMAARTGMRLGELLAVRWGDIDFNSNFVWVRQSYRRGVFTPPKNGKARKVDVSTELSVVLKEHLTQEKKKALRGGSGNNICEFVFHKNGRVIEQNYIRRVFKRILRKAELRDIKLHGLRHTFASILLSNGVSPVYIQKQLGHSSIQITCDIYGHWLQNDNNRGVDCLDTLAPIRTLSASTFQKSTLTS
ncbi:MAG: site-specific integrase [Desulfatiglans sp.]|jgi:integrase|nr:site-specific integrase [Desulfatiglans sp.]